MLTFYFFLIDNKGEEKKYVVQGKNMEEAKETFLKEEGNKYKIKTIKQI
jgi:hypothetical protein